LCPKQLCFFKKAVKSLETVEPHVKSVTEQQHIDYQFSGLEEEDGYEGDDGDDDGGGYDDNDDGELSFDYGQTEQDRDVSTSRNSMEVTTLSNYDLQFFSSPLMILNLFRNGCLMKAGKLHLLTRKREQVNDCALMWWSLKGLNPTACYGVYV